MRFHSDWSDTRRYLTLLDEARRRGEIPSRIPLKYGKPASKKTLAELCQSNSLPPAQKAELEAKYGKKSKKSEKTKTTNKSVESKVVAKAVVKRVTVVNNEALLKKFKAMKKKKMADAYKSDDRCAHIRSVGNGL